MTLGVIKPASCVRRESPKQFRGGEDDQIRVRKTKSARERTENKIDILERIGADQFAETLDLAIGLKINDAARFIFSSLAQLFDELVALRFRE